MAPDTKAETTIAVIATMAAVLLALCVLFDIYKRMAYLRSDIRTIDRMSGEEFEQYLYLLFDKKGYRVKTTPKSNDFGVDLICERKITGTTKTERIAVQAKRYRDKVGVAAIQEVSGGMAYYDCDKAMVITNSLYTDNAWKLARKNNIALWDRYRLKKEIRMLRK